jgi:Ca2+-binding EF-hand superfamily protein
MRTDLIFCFAFLFVVTVEAQDGTGPGQGPGQGRGRFFGPSIGFMTLDTNGDGVLDADEIAAAGKTLLKLDKNSDGQITADEVRPMRAGRGGPDGRPGGGREGRERGPERGSENNNADEMVKTLMAFDANGDGKLSKDELPDRFQGLLAKGDENKDGFLTPDEIRKMVAAQAPPPENARAGGRGGPEGGRPEGRGNMNFIRFDPVLAAVDSNGDGSISAEELRNAPAALKTLDKDGDGKITREEAAPVRRGERQ